MKSVSLSGSVFCSTDVVILLLFLQRVCASLCGFCAGFGGRWSEVKTVCGR